MKLTRRSLFRMLMASTAVAACSRTEISPTRRLARLLGLTPEETAWLASLRPRQQERLAAALASGGALDQAALELLIRSLGPRSRLFAYVGYPAMGDKRSVCDGLIRE